MYVRNWMNMLKNVFKLVIIFFLNKIKFLTWKIYKINKNNLKEREREREREREDSYVIKKCHLLFKKKKWTTNKYLIEACIFQNSFKLNLFQKSKCQNFKLPYKYLSVSQKLMGPFHLKKTFQKPVRYFFEKCS